LQLRGLPERSAPSSVDVALVPWPLSARPGAFGRLKAGLEAWGPHWPGHVWGPGRKMGPPRDRGAFRGTPSRLRKSPIAVPPGFRCYSIFFVPCPRKHSGRGQGTRPHAVRWLLCSRKATAWQNGVGFIEPLILLSMFVGGSPARLRRSPGLGAGRTDPARGQEMAVAPAQGPPERSPIHP